MIIIFIMRILNDYYFIMLTNKGTWILELMKFTN